MTPQSILLNDLSEAWISLYDLLFSRAYKTGSLINHTSLTKTIESTAYILKISVWTISLLRSLDRSLRLMP